MNYLSDTLPRLETYLPGRIDLFICSASFEERSLTISKQIRTKEICRAVVVRNDRAHHAAEENLVSLKNAFAAPPTVIALDRDDPIRTADGLHHSLFGEHALGAKNIVVDITTFTHEALLILIKLLSLQLPSLESVQLIYAHAKEYSVGDAPGDKWLSKGIREIRSVIGYPGDLRPSRKTHVIILAGMESERAKELIEELEPTIISLGEDDRRSSASRPHTETHHLQSIRVKESLSNVTDFEFPCYDPLGTYAIVRKLVETHPDHNTIIAAMNTKLSTIGAALYALENDSVQMCYAQPNLYNYQRYSKPGEMFHLLQWKP